jgi:PAS domain S-box-containing protein
MQKQSPEKRSLEKTIRRQTLPRSLFLVFSLSVMLIVVAAIFVQGQINKRHIGYVENFIFDFKENIESLQKQVNNLAKNDLIINSIIDDSNRDAYLPVFFRSLELTVTENVAILFTDFSGEIITGKNTELYLQSLDEFDWKSSVLEAAVPIPYLHYTENGIMVAAPILYSNSAEGAIVTYVQDLQSAVKRAFNDNLIMLIGADGQILFSSDQNKAALGSVFKNFNTESWYVYQKSFGDNQVVSLEPFISAYSDMFWLVSFMLMSLIAVLTGSLYSTRLSSRMASDMLEKLQLSISSVSSGVGIHVDSLPIENEPKEFEVIRTHYDNALRDLARTTISRDKIENVINSLNEILMVIDSRGHLILSNHSLSQFLTAVGYELPNDLEKILPLDFIEHSNNQASVVECLYAHIGEALSTNDKFCEIRWTRNDYLNEHGQLFGIVVIGTNITESKKLESELLIKNKAIDEAQTAIIISDAQQEKSPITYVNKAFEILTGYSVGEALGKNYRFLQGKGTDLDAIEKIEKALSNEQPATITLLNYKKDGTSFYSELTLNPVFNEQGVVTHILGLQNDVTERENTTRYNKQAKIKAEESAQLKSDFLASMSHEIRTPMNGIMGMLSLLLSSHLNEEQKHHAALAKSSADSLLTIINDILDFSKIEAGKLEIEPIEFNLISQLCEIVESITGKAQEGDVDIILDTSGIEIQKVLADPGRIRQIIINLLGNAIKFTDKGTIIVRAALEVRADNLFFTCAVKDSGIGIEQVRLPLIFDSFTQADASTTRKFGGTGLGLAICKQLVELMGGEISVNSTVGLGSTFSFNLCLEKVSQATDTAPQVNIKNISAQAFGSHCIGEPNNGRNELATSQGARILLVEDNYTNQVLAEALLQNIGYFVDIVGDGKQALAALYETRAITKYELILMDCQMPILDGFEATQKIRKGDAGAAYRSIPIIAMTANAIKGDKEKCLSIGMSDYISKPVNPDTLQEKLLAWLPSIEDKAEIKELPAQGTLISSLNSWNQEEFFVRLSGNAGFIHKIIEAFLIDTPILISQLESAIAKKNFEEIIYRAHTLRGCCVNISANALVGIISNIELAAKDEYVGELSILWEQFDIEKSMLFNVLQTFNDHQSY